MRRTSDTDRYHVPDKIKARTLNLNYTKRNDSFLWAPVTNVSLSTISESSSPPLSPSNLTATPDIYTSVFFEFPDKMEQPHICLSCVDLILWERLSYLNVYPNVSLLRHKSDKSLTKSVKKLIRKLSSRSKSESENAGEVGVLSLPGLTSSSKAINDLGKDVKSIPLNPALLLLSQTSNLLSPEAAWYYEYLNRFEVKEMKRRQEAAEAAEREKLEREAAEAAAAAAQDAVDRADTPQEQPQPQEASNASSPAPADSAPSSPVPASLLASPQSSSKQTPVKPARLSTPGSSSTPATPSSSGKVKSRSRSKSPFRSFRWKTAKKLIAGDRHSDDEEGASPAGEDEGVEGTLLRKHEWETAAKRASNRSWDKLYVVAKDGRMVFYKDKKSFQSTPDQYWRGEAPLDLNGAVVEVAANYTKKKHVFRLRMPNGAEFLLQAHDEAEMSWWLETLRARTAAPAPRSHTLPAPTNTEPKRRSFFTLKKN